MDTPVPEACETSDLDALIDTSRYCLDDLSRSPVIAGARQQLREKGFAALPGFVSPDGVSSLVADAESLAPLAHQSGGLGTAYLHSHDKSYPDGHPMSWEGSYRVGAVAYDLFPSTSVLRRLNEWRPLAELIEAVLDRGPVYPYADPFGALNLAVMNEGDRLQWHFDQTDFVVSLAIQSSFDGGAFEVAPLIRGTGSQHFHEVANVLSGEREAVEVVAMEPGTLLVFEGRNSLHRVTPVGGSLPRLVGLLAYDTEPGRIGTESLRML